MELCIVLEYLQELNKPCVSLRNNLTNKAVVNLSIYDLMILKRA